MNIYPSAHQEEKMRKLREALLAAEEEYLSGTPTYTVKETAAMMRAEIQKAERKEPQDRRESMRRLERELKKAEEGRLTGKVTYCTVEELEEKLDQILEEDIEKT